MTPAIIALSQQPPPVRPGDWRALKAEERALFEVRAVRGNRALLASHNLPGNSAYWPIDKLQALTVPARRPRRRRR